MKILTKEIKDDGSQVIVYLMDDVGNPLKADIVSIEEKPMVINELLAEHFTPDDWVNNKTNILDNVEEITYDEYINQ
jgi:hypothetical protein